MSTVTISHEWRGSHGGHHPAMDDTKINVLAETRAQLAQKALKRPGVEFVEYNGSYGNENATTGWAYYFRAGEETYTFSNEDSDSSHGRWRGTVTCNLTATFDKDRIG